MEILTDNQIDYSKYWINRIDANQLEIMPRHKIILKEIQTRSNFGKVLDLGCGECHILNMLPNSFEKFACDISNEVSIYVKNTKFEIVDLNYAFPFTENKFKFIICTELLEHLYNPESLLENAYNALEKKGTLFISIPNPYNLKYILELFEGKYPSWDKTHIQFWDLNEFAKYLGNKGFKIENYYPTYSSFYFPIKVLKYLKFLYRLFGKQILYICTKEK
jgi:SAM-dependent methyltransferase